MGNTLWLVAIAVMAMSAVPVAASAAASSTGNVQVEPLKAGSVQLTRQANAKLKAKDHKGAADDYEAALAVDPRNAIAYVGLGRSYQGLGLEGKALKYFRIALEIEPNSLSALEAQAMTFLSRGDADMAEKNLARMRVLCKSDCDAAGRLDEAIAASRKAESEAAVKP